MKKFLAQLSQYFFACVGAVTLFAVLYVAIGLVFKYDPVAGFYVLAANVVLIASVVVYRGIKATEKKLKEAAKNG